MKDILNYLVDFKSLHWINPTVGVRFKVFKYNNMQIRLVEFNNQFIESDWCMKAHIGYVLKGQLEIDFNGRIIRYTKGNGIFIPKGVNHKHKAKCISKQVKLILVEDIGN